MIIHSNIAEADQPALQPRVNLPRLPVTSPAQAIKSLRLVDGFRVETVASEPLVQSPVEIKWDHRGRMFVCEMRGYSEHRDERLSRVTRLTDRDGDGVYETRSVFLDGLLWPTAIHPYRDGLFIADAPHIYFCRDRDDDGVADGKVVVLTGFGTDNVQGLLNSFRWGLDQRIHLACSSNGGRIHRPGDASAAVNVRGRDLAFDPDTYDFEVTSGGGQHGMDFDQTGRKFVSSNSDHLQQVIDVPDVLRNHTELRLPPIRQSIAVDGPQAKVYRRSDVEPWRTVRTRLRVSGLVGGPVEGGGRASGYFTGATGVTVYDGDAWPESHLGLAFIGDVGSNLVHRKRITGSGIVKSAHRIDSQYEFMASDDNWFRPVQFAVGPDGNLHVIDMCREVIEHPKSLPPSIKSQVDLNSGRDRGRIHRVVSTEQTSQRRKVELGSTTWEDWVGLLNHPNGWHRRTASRLLFEARSPASATAVNQMVTSADSWQGRLQALCLCDALESLDDQTLGSAMADSARPVRLHAARIVAKRGVVSPWEKAVRRLTEDTSPEVRLHAVAALASLTNQQKAEALITVLRRDLDNSWIRACVSAVAEGTESRLLEWIVVESNRHDEASSEVALQLIDQLEAVDPTGLQTIRPRLIRHLAAMDPAFALPILLRLDAEAAQVRRQTEVATEIVLDHSKPIQQRKRMLAVLDESPFVDIAPLAELLDDHASDLLRDEVVRWFASRAEPAAFDALVNRWPLLSAAQRRFAITRWWSESSMARRVVDAIESGKIAETEVSRRQWQVAAQNSSHVRLQQHARDYLDRHPVRSRDVVMRKYQPSLTATGNVNRGRQMFRQHCATCHRLEKHGGVIGPNLAEFAKRGKAVLLVNVLDPNREVNPAFVTYQVLTHDGRVLSGAIREENARSVTLVQASGDTRTIARTDIDTIRGTGRSLMPEGYEDVMNVTAMTDLLQYLVSQTANR